MDKLSVVIVNFNSGDFLSECLTYLEKITDEADLEIFVVDNASTDGSIKKAKLKFPGPVYILNNQNLGFGKANNLVLVRIESEFILLLNPDTRVNMGVLTKMLTLIKNDPTIGAATCKIVLGNGKLDLSAHRGFPTPWTAFLYYILKNDSLYHLKVSNMSKLHEVDAISGAFFLTRKSVLNKVGFFDESFFMYGEDIDLCYRIKQAGYKIVYEPSVEIIHQKGISSGLKKHSQKITSADYQTKLRAFDAFYESMKIFYKKHYEKIYPNFVNWLVYLGINLKWILAKRKLTV